MVEVECVTNNLDAEVIKIIQDFTHKERIRNRAGNENDILSTEQGQSLKKQLVMKADKIDIEKLYELKSNKKDTDNMVDCQQIMCKQFKHILVLFIEVVNFNNARANESQQAQEKRQMRLID